VNIVTDIGAREKYTAILELVDKRVLYGTKPTNWTESTAAIDLTQEVIDLYNSQWAVGKAGTHDLLKEFEVENAAKQ
jgi:hypothetical protein